VRQLIARISPELHDRIKRKAAAEHRSMNAVVTDVLEAVVDEQLSGRERFERQAAGTSLRVGPPPPRTGRILTREELFAMTRGAGTIGDVIEEDRSSR